jgi:hypothetical protein
MAFADPMPFPVPAFVTFSCFAVSTVAIIPWLPRSKKWLWLLARAKRLASGARVSCRIKWAFFVHEDAHVRESAWFSHQVLTPRAGSSRKCSQGRQITSIRLRASGCLYHS